jgi:hypothetical protein
VDTSPVYLIRVVLRFPGGVDMIASASTVKPIEFLGGVAGASSHPLYFFANAVGVKGNDGEIVGWCGGTTVLRPRFLEAAGGSRLHVKSEDQKIKTIEKSKEFFFEKKIKQIEKIQKIQKIRIIFGFWRWFVDHLLTFGVLGCPLSATLWLFRLGFYNEQWVSHQIDPDTHSPSASSDALFLPRVGFVGSGSTMRDE